MTDSNARQTSTTEKNNEPLTAPKKNGGGSANINSCAINKHCAGRQFSASNPPLLLAANRYVGSDGYLAWLDHVLDIRTTDFIELERSIDENETKKAVSKLTDLMEAYTNGGLLLIQDKLELNENYFISSLEAPLNFLLKTSSLIEN